MNLGEQLGLLRLLVAFCEDYKEAPGSTPTTIDDIAEMIVRDMKEAAPRRRTTHYVMQIAEARAGYITHHARSARGNVSA